MALCLLSYYAVVPYGTGIVSCDVMASKKYSATMHYSVQRLNKEYRSDALVYVLQLQHTIVLPGCFIVPCIMISG